MHILLLILKIIGIVFLCVLGIILLTALLVLFVPIRYKIKDMTVNGEGTDFNVTAGARWLLGIVSVRYKYPDETGVVLRVFGIPIRKRKRKNTINRAKNNKKADEANKENPTENVVKNDKTDDNAPKDNSGSASKESTKKEKKAGFFMKITNYFRTVCDKIRNIFNAAKNIKKNAVRLLAIPGDKENKKALRFIKGIVIKAIKHAGPRKIKAELVIGTGDPCNTGLLFGGLGIAMAVIPGEYNLTPDFYEKKIEGRVLIKGRIYISCMLYYILKIILSKEFNRIKKEISKVRT